MLLIQRNMNITFILLLFSLLGTVFGLLGAMKAFMIAAESYSVYLLEKLKKRQEFQKMLKTVSQIRINFEGETQTMPDSTLYKGTSSHNLMTFLQAND
jgi:uncharacterized SAM-binding protein YcdF (DUF218 family)